MTTEKPPATDAGQAQVAAMMREAAEKGYFGTVPDEAPNEAYTLAGVTKAARESEPTEDAPRPKTRKRAGSQ